MLETEGDLALCQGQRRAGLEDHGEKWTKGALVGRWGEGRFAYIFLRQKARHYTPDLSKPFHVSAACSTSNPASTLLSPNHSRHVLPISNLRIQARTLLKVLVVAEIDSKLAVAFPCFIIFGHKQREPRTTTT